MEGFLAAGVGNMGNAAGALQATTTCTPTGASNVVPVASATNIAVGQYVIINGVSAGTVTAISGTNITLSVTPAAGSSVSWRSSFFSDAQQVGASGGVQNVTMTSDQMPSHTHTVTDPGHHHGMNFLNAYANGIAGATNGGGSAGQTGDSTTGITLGNTGGGHPFGIIQPSRLFTFYMKL
jgi:hypothetical protein